MTGTNMARAVLIVIAVFFYSATGFTHHSFAVHFDRNDLVEIEGNLVEVQWRNPHVQLKVATRDEAGNEIIWQIEEVSINEQVRRGVTKDRYVIGDEIRVYGLRGRRNKHAILATNTLLVSSGIELTSPGKKPRWSSKAIMTREEYQASRADGSTASAMGLFRVWSRYLSGGRRSLWNDSYPLTEYARTTQENWDPVGENPFIFCQNGMPGIMDSGSPIAIRRDGDDILILAEELDTIRKVHMRAGADKGPPGPFGHSVGSWDGDTLVVKTTDIDFPWFDQSGIPQSDALTIEERFSVSEDQRFLDLHMTATDPAIFTEPVVLDRTWVWVPDVEIQPFDCSYDRTDL